MENLIELRTIKQEVMQMDFNYKDVHRIMCLVYRCKSLFEDTYPVPNKEIALDQTKKVIAEDVSHLIQSDSEEAIRESFGQVLDNFKMVLNYIN